MNLPEIVSPERWRAARIELLAEEKALTRARDALNTKRRRLPMVRIDKEYVFDGSQGKASLLELFEGRRRLIVDHFMFDPSREEGCPGCSADADEVSGGLLEHLHTRDTTLAAVSRAPLDKIEQYKARSRPTAGPGAVPALEPARLPGRPAPQRARSGRTARRGPALRQIARLRQLRPSGWAIRAAACGRPGRRP
jgi:hypothetical protein